MIRTQIQLTEDQVKRLKRVAGQRGVSVAEVIREAVEDHLAGPNDATVFRRRAIAAIGGFRSGHRDVSEDHDRHLADDSSR